MELADNNKPPFFSTSARFYKQYSNPPQADWNVVYRNERQLKKWRFCYTIVATTTPSSMVRAQSLYLCGSRFESWGVDSSKARRHPPGREWEGGRGNGSFPACVAEATSSRRRSVVEAARPAYSGPRVETAPCPPKL